MRSRKPRIEYVVHHHAVGPQVTPGGTRIAMPVSWTTYLNLGWWLSDRTKKGIEFQRNMQFGGRFERKVVVPVETNGRIRHERRDVLLASFHRVEESIDFGSGVVLPYRVDVWVHRRMDESFGRERPIVDRGGERRYLPDEHAGYIGTLRPKGGLLHIPDEVHYRPEGL